ncbi:hypothetical protein UCDDA912_g07448 [Diaporthe ampelina]|uniref:Uncharacterized protein n=1 Tax=Diaporthe ampelina TaxID=1214573 RepID=A0A0G2FEH5_9PEZI|nr:hypothetical protein UCDDA912_g07448 [Diaporthe ampelina]
MVSIIPPLKTLTDQTKQSTTATNRKHGFLELNLEIEAKTASIPRAMIGLREQSVEDRVEIIRVNTELSESRQKSKVNDAKIAALEEEARIRKVADDDSEDLRGLLERRVAELEENLELSRQEVAYKADLLNRTSVATILQRAMTKNKGLGTTSLAELLYEMGGSDDMGNSGSKHSEDHQG